MIARVYDVVIDSQCDDGPSDIDGFSEFDTSTVTQALLTNETSITQNLDDFTVSINTRMKMGIQSMQLNFQTLSTQK